jgi:osmotically-inducible protein OsmY
MSGDTNSDAHLIREVRDRARVLAPGAREIEVQVDGGVVTLKGAAAPDEADQLAAAVRRIPGVDEVRNRVQVLQAA